MHEQKATKLNQDMRALMQKGYREMAQENRRLAEEAFPLTSAMLLRQTTWDERDYEQKDRLHPPRSRIPAGYGVVKPKRKPQKFRKIRKEVEREMGEESEKFEGA